MSFTPYDDLVELIRYLKKNLAGESQISGVQFCL